MNQKKKHGMWLRLREPDQSVRTGWLLSMITALCSSVILLLTALEVSGCSALYTPITAVITAGCVCILYGVMVKIQKQNWFFPGLLFLVFLLVLLGRRWLFSGFCMFWNQIGDVWTMGSGQVLPELALTASASDSKICLFIFSVFLGSMIAVLCCVIISWEKRVLAVGIPVCLVAMVILFHKEHAFIYLIPCFLLSACLLVCGGKNQENSLSMVFRWIPILCVSVLLLLITSVPAIENWAAGIGEATKEKLHTARYETAYTTLPEGDFSAYREEKELKQTALVVSMEQPEELYLRGFTGAVFENNTWSVLDTKVLEEQEDLLYWLNQNGWNPHSLFEQASMLASDEEEIAKQTVTVQNLNACSRYLYVPYTLCQGEYLEEEAIHTDGVLSDGTRTYLYSVVPGGTETIRTLLNSLQELDTKEAQDYRKAEQAYREFVHQHYLEVPKETEDQLLSYWEDTAAAYGTGTLTSEQAQACVRTFLETCFSEDGEMADIPLPLSEVSGSSYQYATAAVLTLRHFGIPARYVEGYVITSEMAENAEDGSVKIGTESGTAWVEVYQDGIGWLPMDVTPGIEKQPQNAEGEDGDLSNKPPKGEELEEEPEDILEEPEPQGGYVVSIPKVVSWTILFAGLLILLLTLFLVLRRQLLLKRRRKYWEETDVKDATGWIFADTAKLLERLGFSRGKGSMRELKDPIRQRFGESYAAEFEQMILLNARAMFSSRVLEEEHRTYAKAFYDVTLNHLKEHAKWYEKLWMQWVLCLY